MTSVRRAVPGAAALLLFLTVHHAEAQDDKIQSVSIRGVDAQISLQTRRGNHYNMRTISQDVRTLYRTGRFSDVRVEVEEGNQGKRVTFHLVPSRRLILRAVRTMPDNFQLKTGVTPGTPLNASRAHAIAADVRIQLSQQGFPDASVEPEIVPDGSGNADLVLHVRSGGRIRVGKVEFGGESGLESDEVFGAVQALRVKRILPGVPGIWSGWKQEPEYHAAAVTSDIARIRSLYLSRGYFDASVRVDHTDIAAGKATISFLTQAGKAYQVRRWQASGAGVSSRAAVVKGSFRADDLCECLLGMRRNAEKIGVLDFSVRVSVVPVDGSANGDVDLLATVSRGRSYWVRRIDFVGNKRFSDSTIRGNLLLEETDLLDSTLLRKSMDRLNRSSLFEPLNENDVAITTDEKSGVADVRIRLKERKGRSWLLSGPVGPLSLGSLQFSLASRLPAWGQGLLELSSWYASFSLHAYQDPFSLAMGQSTTTNKVLPVFALQRPFIPSQSWTSGVSIAPQLGWRGTLTSYAWSQVSQRFLPWLSATNRVTSALPVIVERPDGEATMFCEPRRPKLHHLRRGVVIGLQFLSAVPVL